MGNAPFWLTYTTQAGESKGDILSSTPQTAFSNRFLDPNHPATNGGLLGLVSGGKLTQNYEKQKEQIKEALLSQEQAIRDLQSTQMENLHTSLQAMGLTPEQQHDYIQQIETANALQLGQFQSQSQMLENSHRRINRVRNYLSIWIVWP